MFADKENKQTQTSLARDKSTSEQSGGGVGGGLASLEGIKALRCYVGKLCDCSRTRVFTRSPLAQDIRALKPEHNRQTDGRTGERDEAKKRKKPNRRTGRQTDGQTGSSALSSCQPRAVVKKATVILSFSSLLSAF